MIMLLSREPLLLKLFLICDDPLIFIFPLSPPSFLLLLSPLLLAQPCLFHLRFS